MAEPYIGEIRLFAGNFAPVNWALCDGSLLPISENDALFALIGTIYGGDGQTTFALPDLRGRAPMHQGTTLGVTFSIGQKAGSESVTLTVNQMPGHSHVFNANSSEGTASIPQGNFLSATTDIDMYFPDAASEPMSSMALSSVGFNQPHENMQPFLALNFIISLYGIFPSQG